MTTGQRREPTPWPEQYMTPAAPPRQLTTDIAISVAFSGIAQNLSEPLVA